ncbi:hypothetical protein ACHAXS_000738 [Conticribra weissflogii]
MARNKLYLANNLQSIAFKQSKVNECVFYLNDVIFLVHIDYGIFVGRTDEQLESIICEIKSTGLDVEYQGYPAGYVGMNILKHANGTYEFTQQTLMNIIIQDVGVQENYTKPVPVKSTLHLHLFKDSPKFDLNFNYRIIVGKLNYVDQFTRPDIMYSTHQIAKYSNDPHKHGEAILYLVKYLKQTKNLGLKFKPNPKQGFDCFCDEDFSGNWNKLLATMDPSTDKSQRLSYCLGIKATIACGLMYFSGRIHCHL